MEQVLRMISECNRALVRTDDEARLAETVCRIVVERGGYRMAWIGYPEDDSNKTVRCTAFFGAADGNPELEQVHWGDDEYTRGPAGTAIRTGEPVVIDDVDDDPDYGPWRAQAGRIGYRCALALPLIHTGKTLGVLEIDAAEPKAFTHTEVSLLSELAGDLAFSIAALRKRKKERQALDVVSASETRLRTIVEHEADALLVVDSDNRIKFANRAAEVLFGRFADRATEVLFGHPKDRTSGAVFGLPATADGMANVEVRRPDGSRSVVEMVRTWDSMARDSNGASDKSTRTVSRRSMRVPILPDASG